MFCDSEKELVGKEVMKEGDLGEKEPCALSFVQSFGVVWSRFTSKGFATPFKTFLLLANCNQFAKCLSYEFINRLEYPCILC
jgi:hypothetical protein